MWKYRRNLYKENKRKNIYIIIFVITTIVASCIAVYFGVVKNNYEKELNNLKAKIEEMNSKIQINQSYIKETENVKDNISTNDLFALDTQDMLLAKIVDGDLFYWLGNSSDNSTFFTTTSSESFYTKVDSNVRRIKTCMLGSDTSISFLAIKEDGSVYIMKVAYFIENNKISILIHNSEKTT